MSAGLLHLLRSRVGVQRSTLISQVLGRRGLSTSTDSQANDIQQTVSREDENNALDGGYDPERWELIQQVKGIDDPFQLTYKTAPAGTQEKPTLVPSIQSCRTVGCICKEDSVVIKWIRVRSGESQRCDCGHYFKLVPVE